MQMERRRLCGIGAGADIQSACYLLSPFTCAFLRSVYDAPHISRLRFGIHFLHDTFILSKTDTFLLFIYLICLARTASYASMEHKRTKLISNESAEMRYAERAKSHPYVVVHWFGFCRLKMSWQIYVLPAPFIRPCVRASATDGKIGRVLHVKFS